MSGPPVALDTIGGITVFEVADHRGDRGGADGAVPHPAAHPHRRGGRPHRAAPRRGRWAARPTCWPPAWSSGSPPWRSARGSRSRSWPRAADLGSLLYGASIAAVGLVFTGVGLVAAQVTEHARGAVGIGLAVLGVAFLLRAIGDVAENGLSWAVPDRLDPGHQRLRRRALVAAAARGAARPGPRGGRRLADHPTRHRLGPGLPPPRAAGRLPLAGRPGRAGRPAPADRADRVGGRDGRPRRRVRLPRRGRARA